MKRITIITPSYNQAQYLEQTICSVLDQGYPRLEYIVMDGGSTDGSVEIIKKYSKHLTYWESVDDRGQSHAINKGLQRATGDIFNWLNSDDYYEPGALATVAEYFADPQTNVVCGRSRIFEDSNRTVRFSSGTDIYPGNLPKTIGWARLDQPETFFRTNTLQTIGLLNENLHYVMDKEWWTRYLFRFGLAGIASTKEVLANFRYHVNSKTIKHKQGFEKESYLLAISLARSVNHSKLNIFLTEVSGTDSDLIKLNIGDEKSTLVSEALSYALLYLADYHYYHNMDDVALRCLDFVELHHLAASDKQIYDRIKQRIRFVPQFVRKLYHQYM